ncbi:shikimate kinase [Leeuwenhoekiella sp. W20_SRS_FM14]|uniref:shikimate kinase n=1 Tax=Leeuwenhoekiella sp. W20_SRS_FM14 TaxID=3240270 RepID=UPI003F992C54
MKIYLIGYMGSGKSTLGKILAAEKKMNFIDFDDYVAQKEGRSIKQIFEEKGEIYFRIRESQYLDELLVGFDNTIISLGGGTPCYGDAIDRIKAADGISVYINVSVGELTQRLWTQRDHRPVLKHQETQEKLEEFIRKHLFERSFYYNQATIKLLVNNRSIPELIDELKMRLF